MHFILKQQAVLIYMCYFVGDIEIQGMENLWGTGINLLRLRGNVGENQRGAPTCRRNLCSYFGYQKYSWIQGSWAMWFQLSIRVVRNFQSSMYHRGQGPPSWKVVTIWPMDLAFMSTFDNQSMSIRCVGKLGHLSGFLRHYRLTFFYKSKSKFGSTLRFIG